MDKWEEALEPHRSAIDEVLGGPYWTLSRTVDMSALSSRGHKGVYELRVESGLVAKFALEPLPWCHGVCVSGASEVSEAWRNKGLGTLLNALRCDIAAAYGYSAMLCTAEVENIPQQKLLAKNHWKKVYEFRNRRTQHQISVQMIEL